MPWLRRAEKGEKGESLKVLEPIVCSTYRKDIVSILEGSCLGISTFLCAITW